VRPQEITRELAEASDLGDAKGIIIASVETGTPADKAGIKPGDVVTSFAGTPITGVAQFRRVVAGVTPGDKVEVRIVRDGHAKVLTAVLEERRDTFVADEPAEEEEETTWFGLNVVELDDPMLAELEIPAEAGVFVISVEGGSPSGNAGMAPGDVIVRIGDRDVENMDDYRSIMKNLEGREKAIAVMIQRDQFTHFVAIKPE
jgi:serine protease Do